MRLEPTRSPGRWDRDLRHISAQKMKMLPSEDSNPLPGLSRHFGAAQGDQAAVPPQDGAGGDQPVHPQPPRQEPDQRGEDRPVGPVQPGPRTGAAQHGDLMPQHEQLGVLGGRRPAKQDQPAAEPDEDEIKQAQGHR